MCLGVLGCGGAQRGEPYQKAISKQESCCNELAGDRERAECKEHIVVVSDPDAQDTAINDATFSCVERHFVCNGMTGTATQESAQEALDCIQAL